MSEPHRVSDRDTPGVGARSTNNEPNSEKSSDVPEQAVKKGSAGASNNGPGQDKPRASGVKSIVGRLRRSFSQPEERVKRGRYLFI